MQKLLILCLLGLASLSLVQCTKNNEAPDNGNTNTQVDTVGDNDYVDLGLISMTLWKATNEKNPADEKHGFYTYEEAVAKFGKNLPTKEQFEELKNSCSWVWNSLGIYKVFGPNGNYILLPASGCRDCNGEVAYNRTYGFYWSSTPDSPTKAWYLNFYSNEIYMYNNSRCYENSVRLVKK